MIIHIALLFPSYVYLSEEVKTRVAHLEDIAASLSTSEGHRVEERRSALSQDAQALLSVATTPSASGVVRTLLSVPLQGVRIHSLALSLPEKGEGQVRITGIAPTRESLRQYHGALSKLSSVRTAELPLSVYAAERDLPFFITLTGTFTP